MLSPSFGRYTVSTLCSRRLRNFYIIITGSEKPLPKEQRRGAIIILGMLAVANRGVVSERVEALLKIGLGSLGKVRRVLRRSKAKLSLMIFRLICCWRGIPWWRFSD